MLRHVLSAAALASATLLASAGEARAAERQVLRGHLPEAVARLNLQPAGRLPATNRLRLAIGLPWRHTNELARLLHDLYDPASPQFRRYLTCEQFTARFGPSEADYQAVSDFAARNGLEAAGTHPNRALLDVAGSVADIERVFRVKLETYQHPTEARRFYAPDAEPSLDLAVPILRLSGLESYTLPHPCVHLTHPRARSQAASMAGTGPYGYFGAQDLRTAYVPNVPLTGAGQRVGLFELDGYSARDIEAYENFAGLPSVTFSNVLLNGVSGAPGLNNVEVSLDIEMAIAMAPGLAEVIVYEGIDPDDVLNRMATDNLAAQLSSSWYWTPLDAFADPVFLQMAAQGQSMFQASGDAGAYGAWVAPPTDDPYVTQVGGTSLTLSANGRSYLSETVASFSSGGISPNYTIPAYQQGIDMSANGGSATRRNLPDVAMAADNILLFFGNGQMGGVGGTSCSAPLWAGFAALVNEAASAAGEPAAGFLNPALYAIGKSSDYPNQFHDITVGNNTNSVSPTNFWAVPGYDLCTGWGTPKGSNLIASLAIPEPLRITPSTELVFTGPGAVPFNLSGPAFWLTNKGSSSVNWALATDADWLTLPETVGTLAAGEPATQITPELNLLANPLPVGTYHATLYFMNLNDQVVQTRQVTLAIAGTPPVLVSAPRSVVVFAGMTASFAVGQSPDPFLSYQWQFNNGTNLTNLADGNGIAGSSTSTLTINHVSPANAGAYSVIVTNALGSLTSPIAVLSVVPSAPIILSPPTGQTVLPGAAAMFSVQAAGDQPLSYLWQFNGTNLTDGGGIAGSTGNTLTIASVTPSATGAYSVVIANGRGSTNSTGAVLGLTSVTAVGVTLDTLVSFTTNSYGFNPYAGLVQAGDGNFYGTTSLGGSRGGFGTIFCLGSNGAVTLVHTFQNGSDGAFPYAGLIQASNGYLYGVTAIGGDYHLGTAFRVSTNVVIAMQSFPFSDGVATGDFPFAGLVQGSDGNFYGTAFGGGQSGYYDPLSLQVYYGYGTVFRMTPGGVLTRLCAFNYEAGANPASTLMQAADGAFYGTAEAGGTNGGWGTIFRVTSSGTLTAPFSFGNTNGARPVAGLVQDTDGVFYGTTYSGGAHGFGTLFKMAADGTVNSLHSFGGGDDGSNPRSGLFLASDGNLYGTTENGGAYGLGTVFRLSGDGTLATLVHFDGYQGANPEGALIQGTDDELYGTTRNGGVYGKGALFRLSLEGPLEITRQPQPQTAFAGDTAIFSVATFGSLPVSYQWLKNGTNLVSGGNVSGAASRTLILSNLVAADAAAYSVFVSNASGSVPSATAQLEVMTLPPSIVSGPHDLTVLAGATATFSVEATGDGPLFFQWQENGTNLIDGGRISGSATATLALSSVSALNAGTYSVLVSNALNAAASTGAILTVVPANLAGTAFRTLYAFSLTSGSGVVNPYAGLIQARDGNLYGTTINGGPSSAGTVFRLSTAGSFTLLYGFASYDQTGNTPCTGLSQGPDGNFYGSTSEAATAYGGNGNSAGTVFKMTPAGAVSLLYPFTGGGDGAVPGGALAQGADADYYGTMRYGGSITNLAVGFAGYGTIFKTDTNGALTTLCLFSGGDEGGNPAGALVQSSDGRFYGTASSGGSNGFGAVFSLTLSRGFHGVTNSTLTTPAAFDYTLGAYPSNGLVQASDGALYGTASHGGTNGGWGTVFRVTTNGTLTSLHSFDYQDGAVPVGGLVQGTDGNLYGTTSHGGIGGEGTVFQITTNGRLTTLVWFNGPNGANPQSSLVQARDGSFYGTAEFGGTHYGGASGTGDGLVFRLTLPLFLSNPLTQAVATVGLPYAASLSTYAIHAPGDTLTFAAVSGPSWLQVAADGTLSGTPTLADIGVNTFTVSLADANGWSSAATMRIAVAPAPLSASLGFTQGTNLMLSWKGGQPPYQVQTAIALANPAWQDLGGSTTNTSLFLTPTNGGAFYRVQGPAP